MSSKKNESARASLSRLFGPRGGSRAARRADFARAAAVAKWAVAARLKRGSPPPEVVVERTNLGPQMDELVAELRRRQKRAGVDPDYDLLRDHFDHLNFALQAAARNAITPWDPINIYLSNGAQATNSPDINFSMRSYLQRYPEKLKSKERSPYLEWLKRGKAAGEIADPAPEIERMAHVLDLLPSELVDALVARRTDLQQRLRTGKLGEMWARAAEIDPLVAGAWPESSRPGLLPMAGVTPVKQMAALHASHVEAGFRRARVLLVVHSARWGGGRRMEGHIAHALASRVAAEEIVVIYTEEGGAAPAGRFPDGVREVDFAAPTADMDAEWQEHTLVMLLRSFQADSVVNLNSGMLHRAMRRMAVPSRRLSACSLSSSATNRARSGTGTAGRSASSTDCSTRSQRS